MRITKRARRVIAHSTAGSSLEGILVGKSRGHYVLRSATFVKDEEESHDLEGEVYLPREKLDFYQAID